MPDTLTEIVQVDSTQPEPKVIERAAALLRAGEVVVFPTETVYGLGADALQPTAVQQIFTAKGRPLNDPLIVHIVDRAELTQLTQEIPAVAWQLTQAFWPGPLTLILPAGPRVPRLVTSGLPTVAVRMPRHPVAQALIRATGSPIAAPSANRFMHVSPTTAQHAYADLSGRVPLILDGGPCEVGVESTILNLCSDVPTVLRPGGISLEELQAILPDVRRAQPRQAHDEQAAFTAPGQMAVHYSPLVPMVLFEGPSMLNAMLHEVQRLHAQSQSVGVLIADEDISVFQESGARIYALGSTPEQIAAHLFAGLRTLEDAGVQIILCRSFAEQGLGLAIHDRLLKAAGGKIVHAS